MFAVKPVCKENLVRKDGTSIIFIQYCHSIDKRTLLNSGIAIAPRFWDKKRLKIKQDLPADYGNPETLNDDLKKSMRIVEDILTHAERNNISNPLTFLKETFKPDFEVNNIAQQLTPEKTKEVRKEVNLDVFFQFDEYIESKRKSVTPNMIKVYNNVKNTLKSFEAFRKEPITFDSFDFNFYEAFVEYMTYDHVQKRRKELIKGFKLSNIGKTIKQLRIFLRNRMRKKIISPINLEDFKILDEECDAIYLTMLEINKFYEADLSDYPYLKKYRDLFVLGCLTGLRFSDFSIINPNEDIRQGMLYKKQGKVDQWVVIPLRHPAYEILITNFQDGIPVICNSKFNKYIKEIARLAGLNERIKFSYKKGNKDVVVVKPKYAWITSHTCRRSFCTNEFLAGTPVELIMKISGHKSLRDFYKYIRITPEEAGQKIKELWQQRGEIIPSIPDTKAKAV